MNGSTFFVQKEDIRASLEYAAAKNNHSHAQKATETKKNRLNKRTAADFD